MIKRTILCILTMGLLPACGPGTPDHPSGLAPGEIRLVALEPVGPDPATLLLENGSFDEWLGSQPAPAGFNAPRDPDVSTLLRDTKSGHMNTTGYTALETWHALDPTRLPVERFHTTVELQPNTRYALRVVATASPGMLGRIGAYEVGKNGTVRVLARNVVSIAGADPTRYVGTFETLEGGAVVLASDARSGSSLPGSITWSSWELSRAETAAPPATLVDVPARRLLVNGALDRIQSQIALYGGTQQWREGLQPLRKNVVRIQREVEPRDGSSVLGNEAFVFRKADLAYAAEAPNFAIDPEGNVNPAWRAILATERALAAQGTHFLAIPIPSRIDLYMDRLYPPASKLPLPLAAHSDAIRQWLERDVLTFDPAPLLWQARNEGETVFWRGDSDIPSGTLKLLAQSVAPLVKSLLDSEELGTLSFDTRMDTIALTQRLVPALMESQRDLVPAEQHALYTVRDANGELFQSPQDSLVLVAGSYAVAHQIRGASFAAHLSAALGIAVAIPAENLDDPQVPAYLASAAPELGKTRLVIFCYPEEVMMQKDWPEVE